MKAASHRSTVTNMKEQELSRVLADLSAGLADRGWKMASAESCTGGWIAKCCTDLAGSSAWFERGFVTYSNEAKMEMLGVSRATLETDGAVSESVAMQMALGARQFAPVEASVAVTGIAGPDGGSPGKPVGTVWFAWSVEGEEAAAEVRRFEGDRESIRRQTVVHALAGLASRIRQA